MTNDPLPLTETTCRLIWSAVLTSEYGLVVFIPDPAEALRIRDKLAGIRTRFLLAEEPRLNDYIIHIAEDCRSLTIKPRLANVLP